MVFAINGVLKETGDRAEINVEGIPVDQKYPLDCTFHEPVRLKGTFTKLGNSIELKGSVEACLEVQCSRCLKDMTYPIRGEIDVIFQKEESDESYFYAGDEIYLDKMILDAISFELPVRYLCSEDCKGLCPKCGADLNIETCGCDISGAERDNPFEKLKGLFD